MSGGTDERSRLVAVTLDEASIGRGNPDQEHERAIAIYDIVEANSFAVPEHDGGPYALHLSLVEKKLGFEIRTADGERLMTHVLSLTPFRRVIRDYEMICDELLPGDPLGRAGPDRGHRHGAARACTTRPPSSWCSASTAR